MRHNKLERPGCTIHYWLGGAADRPLVVFTHGATMDHAMFDEQVGALLPEYRVLTWDVRGHGESRPLQGEFTLLDCAADLIAILDKLDVEQVVLVGQSMGGGISQYTYLHYAERVQAMVIIGAVSIAFPYNRWDMLLLKASSSIIRLWPYEHFKRAVANTTAIKPDVRAYALATINKLTQQEFLQIWRTVTLGVSREGLPDHYIRVPLLLTHGDQDTTGAIRRDAPKWAAYEPDVEYVVIPHAAHNANQDNPQFFNRILLEFLRSHVPAR